MSVSIYSSGLRGIDAQLIEVEIDSNPGIYSFSIVGLPDKAVEESKERISSAIKNSGFLPPKSKAKKVIVNLAPADIKKEGPSYDLPIAIGYLFESGQIKIDFRDKMFTGELSLDGRLKPTLGCLASAILAKKLGFKEIYVPTSNAKETAIIDGIKVIGADNLAQIINHLNRTATISPTTTERQTSASSNWEAFLAIKGQEYPKRALVVAAAGLHNIFMSGPPGAGKTLLAKSLTSILPPLVFEEAIEVAKIYSATGVNGVNNEGYPLSVQRPFRNPHHTTSAVAIIGGGSWPKPGEISLAHRGVLFLDELPEFPRSVLESLRQPLEDGMVTISRASGSIKLPAKFMLVAAMNPCPCGNYGDNARECICAPFNILKYKKKISGPLLDRIDIHINVSRETIGNEDNKKLVNKDKTDEIRVQTERAKNMQLARFKGMNIFSNSEMNYKNVEKLCCISIGARNILNKAINTRGLSLRTFHKILKVSRTIADLEGTELINDRHVAEALTLRINEESISGLV